MRNDHIWEVNWDSKAGPPGGWALIGSIGGGMLGQLGLLGLDTLSQMLPGKRERARQRKRDRTRQRLRVDSFLATPLTAVPSASSPSL